MHSVSHQSDKTTRKWRKNFHVQTPTRGTFGCVFHASLHQHKVAGDTKHTASVNIGGCTCHVTVGNKEAAVPHRWGEYQLLVNK